MYHSLHRAAALSVLLLATLPDLAPQAQAGFISLSELTISCLPEDNACQVEVAAELRQQAPADEKFPFPHLMTLVPSPRPNPPPSPCSAAQAWQDTAGVGGNRR